MSLSESMDRYLAIASALQAGRARYEPPDDPIWIPQRSQVEEIVGFEIPDELWEFWNHDLLANEQVVPLPGDVTVPGPAALLDGVFENYGYLHFSVEEQIPVVRFFRESRLALVAWAGRWPEMWLAGWLDAQEHCHRYRLDLAGMFDAWSDSIEAGDLVWGGGELSGGISLSRDNDYRRPEFDLSNRASATRYSLAPEQIDAAGALAAGAIFDEDHDADEFEEQVIEMAEERRERWEALAESPFPRPAK